MWSKAIAAPPAIAAEHGLDVDAPTPFDGLTVHFRSTAATLMRERGFPRDDAAAGYGHADSGELLDRLYDVGDRSARATPDDR